MKDEKDALDEFVKKQLGDAIHKQEQWAKPNPVIYQKVLGQLQKQPKNSSKGGFRKLIFSLLFLFSIGVVGYQAKECLKMDKSETNQVAIMTTNKLSEQTIISTSKPSLNRQKNRDNVSIEKEKREHNKTPITEFNPVTQKLEKKLNLDRNTTVQKVKSIELPNENSIVNTIPIHQKKVLAANEKNSIPSAQKDSKVKVGRRQKNKKTTTIDNIRTQLKGIEFKDRWSQAPFKSMGGKASNDQINHQEERENSIRQVKKWSTTVLNPIFAASIAIKKDDQILEPKMLLTTETILGKGRISNKRNVNSLGQKGSPKPRKKLRKNVPLFSSMNRKAHRNAFKMSDPTLKTTQSNFKPTWETSVQAGVRLLINEQEQNLPINHVRLGKWNSMNPTHTYSLNAAMNINEYWGIHVGIESSWLYFANGASYNHYYDKSLEETGVSGQKIWRPTLLFGSAFATEAYQMELYPSADIAAYHSVYFTWKEQIYWRQLSFPIEVSYTPINTDKFRLQTNVGGGINWTSYEHQASVDIHYPSQMSPEPTRWFEQKKNYLAPSIRLGTSIDYQLTKHWSWTSKLAGEYYFLPTPTTGNYRSAWGILLQTGIRYTW